MKPNVYLYEIAGGRWRADVRHPSIGRKRLTYSTKAKARGSTD